MGSRQRHPEPWTHRRPGSPDRSDAGDNSQCPGIDYLEGQPVRDIDTGRPVLPRRPPACAGRGVKVRPPADQGCAAVDHARPCRDAELAEYAAHVGVDGPLADVELGGDLLVRAPERHERRNLEQERIARWWTSHSGIPLPPVVREMFPNPTSSEVTGGLLPLSVQLMNQAEYLAHGRTPLPRTPNERSCVECPPVCDLDVEKSVPDPKQPSSAID